MPLFPAAAVRLLFLFPSFAVYYIAALFQQQMDPMADIPSPFWCGGFYSHSAIIKNAGVYIKKKEKKRKKRR